MATAVERYWFNGCAKCSGDLVLSPQAELDEYEVKCIQCGRVAMEIPPAAAARTEAA
ncbi:MAG: hypothetical protein WD208_02370 [Dehalococcoidia bacterium]